ncbi:cystathionine beta-lyase [Aureimonas ureilytica]|uniref:Cystathionine beta-lyase n=1 Tax=Aureimonas ureilytica TaxID=401562 RepID=A0A175RHV1_9HYPH|nr:cystathionine beta-lyase [Aureimonas ureilytica]KTR02863.1 cystathionine beta-lyase [Aureimonas ureilytica]
MSSPTDNKHQFRASTRLIHAGYDPHEYHGFVNPPVVHASTVLFPDAATMRRRDHSYLYGLRGTPTTDALEAALDDLEGSAGTILVPSGLAAISIPLLAFLSHGDHCLVIDSVYGPTRHFCDTLLTRMGVEVEYFDPAIGAGLKDLMRDTTRVVFLEAPGSNTFEMIDIRVMADIARAGNAVSMIDNTWATPLFLRPLDFGVDLSIHALTKYPGGHSDIMLGSVSATAATYTRLREAQMQIGINAAPDDAYLAIRGLKTMEVRLRAHERAALRLAHWLEGHSGVARVLHPALPSFPGHGLWKRQFKGASGLFSFVLDGGGNREADAFLDALRIFGLGYSWGGFESLALQVDLSDRLFAKAPTEGPVIRLQVGLENVDDLQEDLEAGFAAISAIG